MQNDSLCCCRVYFCKVDTGLMCVFRNSPKRWESWWTLPPSRCLDVCVCVFIIRSTLSVTCSSMCRSAVYFPVDGVPWIRNTLSQSNWSFTTYYASTPAQPWLEALCFHVVHSDEMDKCTHSCECDISQMAWGNFLVSHKWSWGLED